MLKKREKNVILFSFKKKKCLALKTNKFCMLRITPSLTIHFQVSAKVTCDSIFLKRKICASNTRLSFPFTFSLFISSQKSTFFSATLFSASLSFYFTYFASIQSCIHSKEPKTVLCL